MAARLESASHAESAPVRDADARAPAGIQLPSDWPSDGPIDLTIHDLPHASSTTEWWYVNTHLKLADGRQLSLFAAFFQIVSDRDEATGAPVFAHSLTWGLSDPSRNKYHFEGLVDQRTPELGLKRLDNDPEAGDPRLIRALREILEKGETPLPDRVFGSTPFVSNRKLELDFDGRTLHKDEQGNYVVSLKHADQPIGAELVLSPKKPPIRHGDEGVVRGIDGEYMYYYFIPRCEVSGHVRIDGVQVPIAEGQGWYDHEFGCHLAPPPDPAGPSLEVSAEIPKLPTESTAAGTKQESAWNWAGIQLDDGTDISAYTIVDYGSDDLAVIGEGCIVSDPSGERRAWVTTPTFIDESAMPALGEKMRLEPTDFWRSKRTFNDYPTAWELSVPQAGIELKLEAEVDDQEFITVVSKPAFWEGRCKVTGTLGGKSVEGLAYIERSGFETVSNLDEFFAAVGEEVRRSVQALMPLEPTFEEVRDLVASEEQAHFVDDVDPQQMADSLIKPIREITDRGGKSWRSYAALACCDVVGGDSREWMQWLAMPELMHVGSLIVDDVQDRSEVRRGGKPAHLLYGDAIAINSGTAAYFQCQRLLFSDTVSASDKLRLYDFYFDALRAGHAGQAIDIDGFHRYVPEAVESGDARGLVNRILACHRLKTAAPAASLARMGALAGGGTDAQIDGVGRFFEALGLAFQVVDDVLNLRGFKGDLKRRGEDLALGEVTLPVAMAFGRIESKPARQKLYEAVASKPNEPEKVEAIIEEIEACGALTECDQLAKNLVEDAWKAFDALVPPSSVKLMLRGFGWYVLERHY